MQALAGYAHTTQLRERLPPHLKQLLTVQKIGIGVSSQLHTSALLCTGDTLRASQHGHATASCTSACENGSPLHQAAHLVQLSYSMTTHLASGILVFVLAANTLFHAVICSSSDVLAAVACMQVVQAAAA